MGVCPVLVPGTVTIKQRLPPSRHLWALASYRRLGGVLLNAHEVAFSSEKKSWGLLRNLFEGCLSIFFRHLFRHHSSVASDVASFRLELHVPRVHQARCNSMYSWYSSPPDEAIPVAKNMRFIVGLLSPLLLGGTPLSLDRKTCNPLGRHQTTRVHPLDSTLPQQ